MTKLLANLCAWHWWSRSSAAHIERLTIGATSGHRVTVRDSTTFELIAIITWIISAWCRSRCRGSCWVFCWSRSGNASGMTELLANHCAWHWWSRSSAAHFVGLTISATSGQIVTEPNSIKHVLPAIITWIIRAWCRRRCRRRRRLSP